MAAAVLAHHVADLEAPKILVTSSGTGSWHIGEDAHQLSRQVWERAGYTHAHSARQFQSHTFDEVDLILAMDLSNQANILKLAQNQEQREKVAMLRSFDPGADSLEVPDPWGEGIDSYQEVLVMVEAAISGLLKTLR